MGFDRLAVTDQLIRGAIQPHQGQPLEIHVQQFAQSTGLAPPLPGGPLRTRHRHAADEVADHRRPPHPVQAQLRQQFEHPQGRQRPQPDVFHPDRTGTHQFQRVDLDGDRRPLRRGHFTRSRRRRLGTGHPLRRIALRQTLQTVRQRHRQQTGLATDQLINAAAQQWPVRFRHRKVASEVEQRELPHLATAALATHQTEGEVRLAGGFVAGGRTPDKHAAHAKRSAAEVQYPPGLLCHYETEKVIHSQ